MFSSKGFLVCLALFLGASVSYGISVEERSRMNSEGELDENVNLSIDEFEYKFNKKVDDPVEKRKRARSLRKNEAMVKEENEDFLGGQKTWSAKIYEFSDLTKKEFKKEKTGDKTPDFSRGLGDIQPPDNETYDERSERYFDKYRLDRANVPSSYSAVDLNIVTPVRNQMGCGSCVAFATVAILEICYKKITGLDTDYSEQEVVDCAYDPYQGAKGCNGAMTHAYARWIDRNKRQLTHESNYPYLNKKPKLRCPRSLDPYHRGAKVTNHWYTWAADEELLKKMVYEKGSVVTSVYTNRRFMSYKDGIFDSCGGSTKGGHAIALVGYGTENGVDFWLIKNSWGPDWGEAGYMRMKRGVRMCGIGRNCITLDCAKDSTPTVAPLTTVKPCFDKFSNCGELKTKYCKLYQEHCPKSCGLCPGQTPHPSNTCYDSYSTCASLCNTIHKDKCKYSCGLCDKDSKKSSKNSSKKSRRRTRRARRTRRRRNRRQRRRRWD